MAKENRKVKNSVLVDLFYEDEFAEENDRMLYNMTFLLESEGKC